MPRAVPNEPLFEETSGIALGELSVRPASETSVSEKSGQNDPGRHSSPGVINVALTTRAYSIGSNWQCTSISDTEALFGSMSAVSTKRAMSPGWLISWRGISSSFSVMSVAT